jgi:predicted YcjX-like family ATPase
MELGTFDLLINDNSIFLFLKSFGFIPGRITNLFFSNSNRKNTKRGVLLREYKIDRKSVKLVYYPDHLMNRSRQIILKNLSEEQLSILEKTLEGKSRRFY